MVTYIPRPYQASFRAVSAPVGFGGALILLATKRSTSEGDKRWLEMLQSLRRVTSGSVGVLQLPRFSSFFPTNSSAFVRG